MEQDYSGMKVKTCIIDPVSSQFNRGGFCYFPFVLEAAIEDSFLIEEFGAAELDKLPQAEEYLIALWSYPQIEHVAAMLQFLPKGKARVFGYNPLITAMGQGFQQAFDHWESFFYLPHLARLSEKGYRNTLGPLGTDIPYDIFYRNVLIAMQKANTQQQEHDENAKPYE